MMMIHSLSHIGTIKAFGRNFGANEELFLEIDQNEAKLTGKYTKHSSTVYII